MRIAVLGAGAWGSALAIAFAGRHEVSLWARDAARALTAGAVTRPRVVPALLGLRMRDAPCFPLRQQPSRAAGQRAHGPARGSV